jgi:uncharacterized protein
VDNPVKLPFINDLEKTRTSGWDLIQVILGPRQVGKTTGVLRLLEGYKENDYHYASADGLISQHSSWLNEQWMILDSKNPEGLLVVDEIQKIENWSETIKMLWDQQKREKRKKRLILLGSSSLQIQKGLQESLTGRFFLHPVYHWNLNESQKGFNMSLNDFLRFGGYPGSYPMMSDPVLWLNYMKNSIVDTVIGKDILQISRVKSPALFRQCFDLACSYGGQEISYNKLLGQIQDKGNVELVKHYLELFEGAFLLKQLSKFSMKKTLSRASSPKILPMCPGLYSANLDADLDSETMGRAFEIAVGCELARLPGSLYYWRQNNYEVDYVYQFGKKNIAIEVKSGKKRSSRGLDKFLQQVPSAHAMIVTPDNFSELVKKVTEYSMKGL